MVRTGRVGGWVRHGETLGGLGEGKTWSYPPPTLPVLTMSWGTVRHGETLGGLEDG